MSINSINLLSIDNNLKRIDTKKYGFYKVNTDYQDVFNKSENANTAFQIETGKNYTRIISFTGLQTPLARIKPAIQMRVTGVTNFQDNMDPEKIINHTLFSINRLADSFWKDGDSLIHEIINGQSKSKGKIKLISPVYGEIGRVPDEITPFIFDLMKNGDKNFRFELSNVVAGNTKGAPTIGLRVNLLYHGKDQQMIKKVQEAFDEVLNNPEAAKKAFFYQPIMNPKEVLTEILKFEKKTNGSKAAEKMKETINNIVSHIENPENKKILLVGHCKPDGDTLGCIMGLKNSINMVLPDKIVDCAVDDQVTGLFRHKLPGIDDTIKHPYSESKIKLLEEELKNAQKNSMGKSVIESLEYSLSQAKNENLLLRTDEKYDMVILMDVPAPARFSSGFKKYIQEAKEVVYIDHHPFRKEEWDQAIDLTGLNMGKILKDNLAWIAERVPAATQQAVIIASRIKKEINPLNPDNLIKTINNGVNEKLNAAVASFTAGMSTDTGGFSRTANLISTDIIDNNGARVSVQSRPNFWPEGLSKWLFKLTNDKINKKWMREELTYDVNDDMIKELKYSARDKMVEYSEKNKHEYEDIGLGIVKASFDEMQEILSLAHVHEPETNLLDVQNSFKFSEVMSEFRDTKNQTKRSTIDKIQKEESGLFDKDKIAVFICQSEKAGTLNTEGKKSIQDALRFSFRSQEGTDHAEILANLFNGGGHGAASGGHIKGNNVTLDSKFTIKINGEKVTDFSKIYDELIKNHTTKHNEKISSEERNLLTAKIELVQDENGITSQDIIENVVKQIRNHQSK